MSFIWAFNCESVYVVRQVGYDLASSFALVNIPVSLLGEIFVAEVALVGAHSNVYLTVGLHVAQLTESPLTSQALKLLPQAVCDRVTHLEDLVGFRFSDRVLAFITLTLLVRSTSCKMKAIRLLEFLFCAYDCFFKKRYYIAGFKVLGKAQHRCLMSEQLSAVLTQRHIAIQKVDLSTHSNGIIWRGKLRCHCCLLEAYPQCCSDRALICFERLLADYLLLSLLQLS